MYTIQVTPNFVVGIAQPQVNPHLNLNSTLGNTKILLLSTLSLSLYSLYSLYSTRMYAISSDYITSPLPNHSSAMLWPPPKPEQYLG